MRYSYLSTFFHYNIYDNEWLQFFFTIEVVALLKNEQFHVAGLHSEKSQDVRFKIIDCMKKG